MFKIILIKVYPHIGTCKYKSQEYLFKKISNSIFKSKKKFSQSTSPVEEYESGGRCYS